eukprot:TRINITY_DN3136_c0_g1_i2.p1 TRINITY_DN3136_c0_g1~~TRINITY_DN3136_c0_g1_i2.p1  ORF type:complete len:554 (-),score=55.36 TRINITY_DN3136_c0_g1_i2:117-1778(-)
MEQKMGNWKSEVDEFLKVIRETGIWKLYIYLIMYMITVSMFVALIPNLETNYFASQAYGSQIKCEDTSQIDTPAKQEACRDSHGNAVWWDASSSFLCYTILNSFIAPTIGHFADLYGRKPFLLLSQMFPLLPMGILLAYNQGAVSWVLYYPSYAITNAMQPTSVALAYIADLVDEEHRSAIFGIALCCLTMGTAAAAPIGALLGLELAIVACIVLIFVSLGFVLLFLPESLTRSIQQQHREETKHNELNFMRKGLQGLVYATRIIVRSSLFIKLTVVLMAFGIVFEGLLDLLRQYLQLILLFSSDEQSVLFIILGLFSTVTLLLLLQPLVAFTGLVHTLQIGVLSTFLQMLLLVFSTTKWEAYAGMVFAGIGCLQIPVIGAIVANNATSNEQGIVQGAMFGAKSLAQGLGPLFFAYLFSTFTQTENANMYFPQAPIIFGSVMMFVSLVVSLTIPSERSRRWQGRQDASQHAQDASWGVDMDSEEDKLQDSPLLVHDDNSNNGNTNNYVDYQRTYIDDSSQFILQKYKDQRQDEVRLTNFVDDKYEDQNIRTQS